MENVKQTLLKTQRANERILKQLYESTQRQTILHTEYDTKEKEFKERLASRELELKKLQAEIERSRQDIKEQVNKVKEKIKYKEDIFDKKLKERTKDHQLNIKKIQIDIEEAQQKNKDLAKIKDLEIGLRNAVEEKSQLEVQIGKLETQLHSLQLDIHQEKETATETQDQIKEMDKTNTKLKESNEKKEGHSQEILNLNKKIQEIERELSSNKDLDEKIIALKTSLRSFKTKNDDIVQERDRLEKTLTRAKTGLEALSGERESPSVRNTKDLHLSPYERAKKNQGDYRKTGVDKSKDDEKKIRDLKDTIKNLKRDKDRELEKVNKELTSTESSLSKAQSNLNKIGLEKKGLQKLLKQDKEYFTHAINALKDKQIYFTQRKDIYESEYKKSRKFLQEEDFKLSELKRQLDDTTKTFTEKSKLLNDTELDKNQHLRSAERAEKDLTQEQKNLNSLTDKLQETQLSLLSFQKQVQSTQEEFKVTKQDMMLDIHTLEAEIYDQTDENETIERIKAELTNELAALKWYFLPAKEKRGTQQTSWYSILSYDFNIDRKKARDAELEAIKEELNNTNLEVIQKTKEAEDFKKDWERSLEAMPNDERGDLLFEMRDLMEAMRLADYKQRSVLQTMSLLAEYQVYPGAVRELTLLTKTLRDQHIMQKPTILLNVVLRDYKRDTAAKSFRRRLLERLVVMRMKRTGKSRELSENFIFYGEDYVEEQ